MEPAAYAIGQAVYIRTDTPDYAEVTLPFTTLAEMVEICSSSHPNLTLDRVIVYSMVENEPCALTLSFVAASKGQGPGGSQVPHFGQ
jgi:hypothetical protein